MNDLKSFMSTVVQRLEKEGRYGTAHVYQSTLNAISRYWQSKQKGPMSLDRVFTTIILQDFERYMLGRMLSMNTVSTYLRMLRAVYNHAARANRIKWRHGLFDTLYTGVQANTKRALTPDHMGRMLITQQALPSLEEAQSWFALLFMLRGMPFIDLARLRKCDLHGNTLTNKRQKTGKIITVNVTSEAMRLVNQLADRNPDSPYLLSILPENYKKQGDSIFGSKEEHRRYQAVLRGFNRRLKDIALKLNLGEKISSYTARHTWATTAYQKKCAIGIICNALGHSSIKVTETYLKAFEQKEIDLTNMKIISYVKREANKGVKSKQAIYKSL